MRLEGLQDDLARFDAEHYYVPAYWKRIGEVARLVADPNIEAAFNTAENLIPGEIRPEWVNAIVAAALTPGDTDEH